MMGNEKEYFIGLDMGVSSVGWAVTDPSYNVIKKHGKALWGIRLFDEAQTAAERRMHRTSRRRLERRNRRIALLQELFAEEITKKDPAFFQRLKDSAFYAEDKKENQPNSLFNDVDYNDKVYHKKYPTIYHLRQALMNEDHPFDVRLVYLAIHHMMLHRGHFLFDSFEVSEKGISGFDESFDAWTEAMERVLDITVDTGHKEEMKNILKDRELNRTEKKDGLIKALGVKDKYFKDILALVSGGTAKLSSVFDDESLKEGEKDSISFSSASYDDDEPVIQSVLGERFDVIDALHGLYRWGVLAELMGDHKFLSDMKVAVYEKHGEDLEKLKKLLKADAKTYDQMFKSEKKGSYGSYAGICIVKGKKVPVENTKPEDFFKGLKKIVEALPKSEDRDYVLSEIDKGTFLPKSVTKENSVIPYQLHALELKKILKNAEKYLPFLNEEDKYGSISDKIQKLFEFRVPYYVGPLNNHSKKYWSVRKENGKVYPWNFEDQVDMDGSAKQFIRNLTNKCTYLRGKDVLPKDSLIYSEFMVLNELNNVRVGSAGEKLTPELKEKIIHDLFMKNKHITVRKLKNYLVKEGYSKEEAEEISGIDQDFKGSLASYIDLTRILGDFSREEGERIISDITIFGADRKMLKRRLKKGFPSLAEKQLKDLVKLPYKGWGRLSGEFLEELLPEGKDEVVAESVDPDTGEIMNIITMMKKKNYNLMELLSSRFGYMNAIENHNRDLETGGGIFYKDVKEMYVSPSVKRPLWQALRIVKEIVSIMKLPPAKVFIEMARGGGEKGKRTVSRKAQLIDLYKKCKDDTRDWRDELEKKDESDFRSDRLFLYYLQMGRSMYTGKPIDISQLYNANIYDVDHIYPQSVTGDDSLTLNRVLVERTVNGKKGDTYPLGAALNGYHNDAAGIHIADIQEERAGFWKMLLDKGFMTKEKYNRLTRTTPLTGEEKADFIGRQLVETRQSTKAAAELLKQAYPETRIVYTKAGNASLFRQYAEQSYDKDGKYDRTGAFVKVRDMNDFHHAKDAYLNIVVGNVYDTKFTSNPLNFIRGRDDNNKKYSLKPEVMYRYPVIRGEKTAWIPPERDEHGHVIPDHEHTMGTVRKWMSKNNILFTRMTVDGAGVLFDQNLMKKGKGQVSIKSDSPLSDIAKYGGYNKAASAYFTVVKSIRKGKEAYTIETIPLHLKEKLKTRNAKEAYFRKLWEDAGKDWKNPVICIEHIPIKALLEINGFRAHLAGKSGDAFVIHNGEQLLLSGEDTKRLKNILKFNERRAAVEKGKKGAVLHITAYDGISDEDVNALYEIFQDKLANQVYNVKLSAQVTILEKGKEKFDKLSLEDRCKVLGEILHFFQCNAVSADLRLIGGVGQAGALRTSTTVSADNHMYLVSQSITGFFEKKIPLIPEDTK